MTHEPGPAMVAGRYRLEHLLGRGGMATVHRATDTQLGREVAVKLMRPELGEDEVFRSRFVNEARNAASITHPNVVTVYDFGTDGPGPYLVMELVDGGDVARLIADGPLPAQRAAVIAAEVASALAAAHAHGIVHRDVKPGNILIASDGHPRVADFGIARATGEQSLTGTGTSLGSVEYFSPEQARGEAATAASDVYALGVVLYEMLTGRRPFAAETPYATAVARVESPPPDPRAVRSRVPKTLAEIVMRAMATEPHARFPSAAEMARALETWLTRQRAAAERREAKSGLLAGAAAAASAAMGTDDADSHDELDTQPVPVVPAAAPQLAPRAAANVTETAEVPTPRSPTPRSPNPRGPTPPATTERRAVAPSAARRSTAAVSAASAERVAPAAGPVADSAPSAEAPSPIPVGVGASAPLAAAAAATATASDPPPSVPHIDGPDAPAAPTATSQTAPPAGAQAAPQDDRRRGAWLAAAAAVLLLGVIGFLGGRLLSGTGGLDEPVGGIVVGEPQGAVLGSTPEATPETSRTPQATAEPTDEPTAEPTTEPTVEPTEQPTPEPTPVPVAEAPPPPPTPAPQPRTPAPTPVAVAMALTPDQTIATWYSYVEDGQFDAAYSMWSERMRADFPREGNLDNRWRNTADITFLQIYTVEQTATYATVQVDFIETRENGSSRRFIGWWELIRSRDGWVLDQPHF